MKTTRTVVALALLLAAASVAEPAFAWGRSHVRVGVFVGVPLFGFPYYYPSYYYPPYYYPPYYYPPYYPTTVVAPSQPTVYIEQGSQPAAPSSSPSQSHWWYYCADSRAYYPYVRDCPGGWQRVSPQPPS